MEVKMNVLLLICVIYQVSAAHVKSTEQLKVKNTYDYDQVLHYSNLFYQAQRSGPLDVLGDFDHTMIPYRGDSCMQDGSDNGLDLTGGYFDAGDYVKFNFPMAASATLLAWGAIDFKDAYEAAGQMEATLNTIRWATDYFIKCHPEENVLYAQVGDGYADHAQWGRVEQMTIARPSYKVDAQKPGSDLAGEISASLTSASLAFATADPAYSATLLEHAKQLFNFADKYRAKYTDSVPEAAGFYNSWSGYNDELLWSAAWLYKATGDQMYMDKVNEFYGTPNPSQVSWDDKYAGSSVLLARTTGEQKYVDDAVKFCNQMADYQQKTPAGLLFIDAWGALRHASNVAFVCLEASMIESSSIDTNKFQQMALDQIHYTLGDNGHSFVVGFGVNPPARPHHRSSSCPVNPSEQCDWQDFDSPDPNPSTLYGALVGGPDGNDAYWDDRHDFSKNEVATDYNAGFQSAVAGLKGLALQGKIPQHNKTA